MFGRLTLPNHEPVFLNEGTSCAELELKKMEALRSIVSKRDARRLEEDIRLVRAGITGERKIIFELKNAHYPLVFIHDLNLEHEGTSAQIDFFVITPYRYVIIETKNLIGNIEIDETGAFVRTVKRSGRIVREGIYSPVTQNERHIDLMKAIHMSQSGAVKRQLQRFVLDASYKSVIVLANEKTLLTADGAPADIRSKVIRADQLVPYIKNLDASVSKRDFGLTFKEMESIGRVWLSSNAPTKVDLTATYEIASQPPSSSPNQYRSDKTSHKASTPAGAGNQAQDPKPQPNPSKASDSPLTPPACPLCGAPMVKRTARYGARKGNKFWGCSTYGTTHCKGIINIDYQSDAQPTQEPQRP